MNAVDPLPSTLLSHVLRQADRALVLAQRLLQQITHAPEIEEDMALANVALDLIGQARLLYTYAGAIEGLGHDEDHFAYWRDPDQFLSPLLVEQPNVDFAHVVARQYLHDQYAVLYWRAMTTSTDETLAAIAAKAVKETTYHVRHSRGWLVRLGDGTPQSHERAQVAVERLMPFSTELFRSNAGDAALVSSGVAPDPSELHTIWSAEVQAACDAATLAIDSDQQADPTVHSDDFDELIGEMQVLARAHPGATW